jgi:predicted DNA-binding protein
VSRHRSIRMTTQLEERVASIAKSKGVSFSAAMRFALERGVAAMEKDAQPPAPAPVRKVLSRGVGF